MSAMKFDINVKAVCSDYMYYSDIVPLWRAKYVGTLFLL